MDESASIGIAALAGVAVGVLLTLTIMVLLNRSAVKRQLREEEGRKREELERSRDRQWREQLEQQFRCVWCRDKIMFEAEFGWAMCDAPDHGLGLVPTRIFGVNLEVDA